MTAEQRDLLVQLSTRYGVPLPFISNNVAGQNVTKAEASRLITMFDSGIVPSAEFIASLGYAPQVSGARFSFSISRLSHIFAVWLKTWMLTIESPFFLLVC